MARPTKYSADIADTICERLADGMSLRKICLDETMPDKATVCRWLALHDAFRDQYAYAREAQADGLVDETLDIADDGTNDYLTKKNSDGSEYQAFDAEHVQRSKLRVDTRKWMASKLAPKKYGEKVTLAGDAENPLLVPVINLSVSGSSGP